MTHVSSVHSQVAKFYERAYPAAVPAAAEQPSGALRVLLATTQLLHPEEALAACRSWMPQGASAAAKCEGTAFADGGMPADVAALRTADVLVSGERARGWLTLVSAWMRLGPSYGGGAFRQGCLTCDEPMRRAEHAPTLEQCVRQTTLLIGGCVL